MSILFSTTAAEAVVINFELRIGSLERLLLAPIGVPTVLLGKVLGGVVFGLIMALTVTSAPVIALGLHPNMFYLILTIIPSLFAFSALGAFVCVLVKEVFEAQTLLNLPRFLMVFLCGVVYPVSAMPKGLQYLAYAMPLTYTVNGLRQSFSNLNITILIDTLVLTVFFFLFIFPAIKLLSKKFE